MANRALAAKYERALKERRELARIEGSKPFYQNNPVAVSYDDAEVKRVLKGESTTREGRQATFEEHRGLASVGKTNRTTTPHKRPEVIIRHGWVPQRKRYSSRKRFGSAIVWACDGPRLLVK